MFWEDVVGLAGRADVGGEVEGGYGCPVLNAWCLHALFSAERCVTLITKRWGENHRRTMTVDGVFVDF